MVGLGGCEMGSAWRFLVLLLCLACSCVITFLCCEALLADKYGQIPLHLLLQHGRTVISDGTPVPSGPPCPPVAVTATPRPPMVDPVDTVLYMNGYRPEDYMFLTPTLRKVAQQTGNNIGNLVWMHGASNLLKMPSVHNLIYSSLSDPRLSTYKAKAFYFPVANIFQFMPQISAWINRTITAITEVDGPVLLIGVGTKGSFSGNNSWDSSQPEWAFDLAEKGKVNRDIQKYKLNAPFKRLLDVINFQGGVIMARGDYTTAVLRAHGFDRVHDAGCPSLLNNPTAGLGAKTASNLVALGDRLDKGLFTRMVIQLPTYYKPKIAQFLLRFLLLHGENRLVIEQPSDNDTLASATQALKLKVPTRQIAWFSSVPQWKEFMCQFDFVISTRISSIMMGLACAVPGIIIAPDMSVLEMAESMMIPRTDIFQSWLKQVASLTPMAGYRKLVKWTSESFNGTLFDVNRCKKYRMYEESFKLFHLEINPELAAVCTGIDDTDTTGPLIA